MTKQSSPSGLDHLSLGKASEYVDQYSPGLLQPVPRSLNRQDLGIVDKQPFEGVDIWNGYELSWLNRKGKPCLALLQAIVPASSPNLIESKSFKLYLNSFNQWKLDNKEQLQALLEKDLTECAAAPVRVSLFDIQGDARFEVSHFPDALLLDELDVEIEQYQPDSTLLQTTNKLVDKTHLSHLLKSNCLITSQPDWGSVFIRYQGREIVPESLLKYLVSFRQHNEFHEQCVERIFCDLMAQCHPEKLTVYARYTRRGGLDINPFRSNFESPYPNQRMIRQ
ncbi:NADPH-dependent 7-cyano-7-deazaguanine reductase QueF [Bowmanella dokdonensis]|uniref:NADPH-dependent 7-cyano-7-deazaguanine reductase n=1 Tax=Bowmanella dokdonensis TaxID=751969 RepID=A0A939DLM7_9ALTE|nr:NADPH-dependent 7-cyano-7-deazaguanine reductase QueF [Bowmanella dokdonensis]MBN7824829.1 NADPH-dependent 7-cyano-7-deazaguanine reductase QueF [Bowmanella dokdonensis]